MDAHITGSNVFADLGFDPAEAENLKVRSDLMSVIMQHVDAMKLTEEEAAATFDVSKERISKLIHDRIDLFSVDDLVKMIGNAGLSVDVATDQRKAA